RHPREVLKLRVTSRTHEVGLLAKLERCWIAGRVMTVGIMASSTTHGSFLVALRAFQCLYHEGRLAEAAVFVKALAGKFSKGLAQHVAKELCISGIVQFAGCAGLANRGLHMAL